MQSLDLNLSTRPFRNNVSLWVGYGVAVALLVSFTVWSVGSYTSYSRKLGELRNEVGMLASQTRDLEQRDRRVQSAVQRYDLDALALQADKANEIIEWGAFSWTRLFNRMAEIQPHRVRMTSVRPIFGVRLSNNPGHALDGLVDAGPRGVPVSIHAVARTYDDMLEMQRALFDGLYFGDVEMQRLRSDERGGEYVFELRFMYYPEAQPETDAAADEEAEVAQQSGDAAGTDPVAQAQNEGDDERADSRNDAAEESGPDAPAAAEATGASPRQSVEAQQDSPDPPQNARSRVRPIPGPGQDKGSEDD